MCEACKKPFYITTPIYYPSDKLHIGHTYCTVATDAMARYKRLQGYDVMFLTGTDEHGQKIEDKAKAAGVTPQQFVDNIVAGPKGILDLWKLMNISNDRFIRTTDDYHVEAIQKIFRKMYENGDIYKGEYKGKYCTPCESFWTESQLVDGKCPDCGREVHDASEEAYFFRLSKYAGRVRELLTTTDYLQPKSRVNEMINNFIDPGLEDLCVSRTSFTWGVPVDFDPGHVVYVWVDALFNYTTALGFMNEKYQDYEKYWPADVHFVGKEIVRFHSIIWPAMLMSMGMPLPKHVYGHGWLVMDGGKMSKSKGEFLTVSLLEQKQRIESLYGESRSTIAPVHFSVSTQRYPFTEDAFLEMLQQNQENRYQYTLKETSMDGVIDDVYDHRADIGVIFLTKLTEKIVCRLLDGRELTFHELAAVPPCVYVRKGHPLTQLEHVSEADLEGYPYSSFEQAQGVAVDFSEELPMVSMRKPSKAIIVNNRSTAMNVLANTDAYSTGSGLLAEHLSPANVVTIPLADKDPVRLGWIYPQNAKLSSHAEEFVRLLEQSIQRSIAYTSSLHRQIVGK